MIDNLILGIDPGYDRVGWAIGQDDRRRPKLLDLGLIQTDKDETIFARYQQIDYELTRVIKHYHPTEVAIEKLYFAKNVKTAIRVAEARGLMLQIFLQVGLAIFEYDPTKIKQVVTGNGQADKRAIAKMVKIQLGANEKINDDALDAAACYLTHVILRDNLSH